MKALIAAAIIGATASLPFTVSAQQATTAWVCRPAASGETSNAAMGSSKLVCRSVDVAAIRARLAKLHAMMEAHMGTGADVKKMESDMDDSVYQSYGLPSATSAGGTR
jgi:hypothetical protein